MHHFSHHWHYAHSYADGTDLSFILLVAIIGVCAVAMVRERRK